jgi:cell division transport system permease protein
MSLNSMMIASIAGLSFILGLFFILFFGTSKWEEHLNNEFKAYVYLEDSLNVSQINTTIELLKNNPSFNKKDIKFVSKDKIAKDFLASSHENYEELLGDINPFKNLLILGINSKNNSEGEIKKLIDQTKGIEGVYDVSFPINVFSKISPKLKVLTSISILLISILSFWIYLQISNYIRLNIHSNRLIIKSMQLLGSTNTFIRKPYLLNSIVIGIIGSLIGYVLINGFLYYVSLEVPEIKNLIFDINNQVNLFSVNLLYCILFCLISSFIALNKYLKISQVNLI